MTKQEHAPRGRKAVKDAIDGANVVAMSGKVARRKPKTESKCGRFYATDDGLFRRSFDEKKQDIFIGSRIDVVAETRDGESGNWGVLLEWIDRDGIDHVESFAREAASCGSHTYRREPDNGRSARRGAEMALPLPSGFHVPDACLALFQ